MHLPQHGRPRAQSAPPYARQIRARSGPRLDIVISRGTPTAWQDKALAWAQELPGLVRGHNAQLRVYGKKPGQTRGGICSAYLKHIVDNYDNLADFTFFLKDEEWSWTHTGPIQSRFLEAIASRRRYFNINDARELPSVYNSPHVRHIEQWYTDHIDKWIPFARIPNPDWATGYRGGNQFLVHKTLIQELPKEFYENMYRWVMSGTLPADLTDEMLETTWHLFFVIWPRMQAQRRRLEKTGGTYRAPLPPVV